MKEPGVIGELAAIVGIASAIRIAEVFGGQRVYIPRADTMRREIRNASIRTMHENGTAVAVIAEIHGITRQQVYNLLEDDEM